MTKEELVAQLTARGVDNATASAMVAKVDEAKFKQLDSKNATNVVDYFETAARTGETPDNAAKRANQMIAGRQQEAKRNKEVESAGANAAAGAAATGANETDAAAMKAIAEANARVKNGTGTQADQALVGKYAAGGGDLNAVNKVAGNIAGQANNAEALKALANLGTQDDIDAVRAALMSNLGITDLPYSAMVNIMRGQVGQKIANTVMGRRNGYAVGSFTDYTDANGKTVSVRNGVDKALKEKLPGFADYNRAATRTIVDSSERFKGQVGFENIYGLFAYTLGVFDANKNPTLDNWDSGDDMMNVWNSDSSFQGDARKGFIRQKMIELNRLPPRFLPDGTLNPAYDMTDLPTLADSYRLNNETPKSIYQTLWDNPETLLGDTQAQGAFWSANAGAFAEFQAARAGAHDRDSTKASDIMRERMYENLKPKLDAYLAEFGEANSLAAIVAVHNADLGRKMARGLELTDEDLFNVNVVFGGVDPAEVGIVRDSLQRYVDKSTAAKGPTIIQPDRNKISEGFRELYQSMFHAEPSADELGQLVEDVAGKYISSQYSKTEFDAQAAATTALRGRDLYSQLYGNKPTGLSDENYNAQFVGTGQRMLGGMQTSSAALQAGMRSGDVNVTAAVTNVEQSASRDNSAWLENFYKSMQTASEMT